MRIAATRSVLSLNGSESGGGDFPHEIQLVLVRLNEISVLIVNANHSIVSTADKVASPIALLTALGPSHQQRLTDSALQMKSLASKLYKIQNGGEFR